MTNQVRKIEIKKLSSKKAIEPFMIEKDWVLGHILNQIYKDKLFKEQLVIRGGTCIKKMYIENFRFSEDLDFTLNQKFKDEDEINDAVNNIKENLENVTNIKIDSFKISKNENNKDCYEILLYYIGVFYQRPPYPKIKIDIDGINSILLPIENRKIIHDYSDKSLINADVASYSLNEIFSEKLRCFYQRTRARDLYDIWYLSINNYIDFKLVTEILSKKCQLKNIKLDVKPSIILADKIKFEKLKASFEKSLQRFLTKVPDFEIVISETIDVLKQNNL